MLTNDELAVIETREPVTARLQGKGTGAGRPAMHGVMLSVVERDDLVAALRAERTRTETLRALLQRVADAYNDASAQNSVTFDALDDVMRAVLAASIEEIPALHGDFVKRDGTHSDTYTLGVADEI